MDSTQGIPKSVFNNLEVKYQGRDYSRQTNSSIHRITLIGSQEAVMQAYNTEYKIGGVVPGMEEFGKLLSMEVSQDAGPFWLLTCEFSRKENDGRGCDNVELQIGVLTMPIETHKDYKLCWNNSLWCTKPNTEQIPFNWENSKMDNDLIPEDRRYPRGAPVSPLQTEFYCWAKTISECTPLPPGYCWYPCKSPKKPGVISYTIPTITVAMKGYATNLDESIYWVLEFSEGQVYKELPASAGSTKEVRNYIDTLNVEYSNPAFPAAERKNWRVQGSTIYTDKDSYNYSLNFMLSGPGGWDSDIYGIAIDPPIINPINDDEDEEEDND